MSSEKAAESLAAGGTARSIEQHIPPLTEHVYTTSHHNGSRVLKLKLSARSSHPTGPPSLLTSDSVGGTVELDLTESAHIKSVSVEVIGTLRSFEVSDARFVFLQLKKELWSKHSDDTGVHPAPDHTGSFSWPFAIDLPKSIHLNHGGQDEYPLPASFASTLGRTTIVYEVSAIIKYGLLSSVYVAGTEVNVVPVAQPGPPSIARQVAYAEHQPLLGPDDDPTGWRTLDTVTIRGTIFDNREVEVKLTLSVALPLSYASGTSIPVWLVISASDTQALDLLAAETAPTVRLRRVVENRYLLSSLELGQNIDMTTMVPVYQDKMYADFVTNIQKAVWWPISPRASDSAGGGTRVLQGEIHLRPTLPPSMHLGYFKNHYSVCLYPPTAVGFSVSHAKEDSILQDVPIEMATLRADGPRQVTYSAVHYDPLPGEDGKEKPYSLLFMYGYT